MYGSIARRYALDTTRLCLTGPGNWSNSLFNKYTCVHDITKLTDIPPLQYWSPKPNYYSPIGHLSGMAIVQSMICLVFPIVPIVFNIHLDM